MFSQLTSRTKVKEILPHFLFLCHMDALAISALFMKVYLQVGFSSGVFWDLLCPADSPSVLPSAWVQAQGLGTASLDSSLKDTLTKCSGLSNALLGYVGLVHTDWEEDFPAQLTQCSSEVCHMAFSSAILLWKQLSIIMYYLASACSWRGKANIRTTSW